MNEPQTPQRDPLYNAIKMLIDTGRLTGVTTDLKFDGQPFLSPRDEEIDPTPVTNWNDDGTSADFSEFGGQQIKGVEELRAQLLQSGDARKQRIAHALPQFFVRMENIDQFDDRQKFFAHLNHSNTFMTRQMVGLPGDVISTMFEYTPRYWKKGTQEPDWRLSAPSKEVDRAMHGANPKDIIPNHRIAVTEGGEGWTPERITNWAKKWVGQFLDSNEEPSDVLGGDPD